MRNILYSFACLGAFLVFSAGCKEKQEDPTYQAEARINGQPWTSNSVTAYLLIDTVHHVRTVGITAESSGKRIVVEFSDNGTGLSIQPGGRNLTAGNAFFSYQPSSGNYHAVSGSVSVNSVNASAQNMSCTFDFVVMENTSSSTVQVNAGKLNEVPYSVKYQ